MSPPSWTSPWPHTLSHPSRLSLSTGFELHASYSKFPLAIYFTYGNVHVSVFGKAERVTFSQFSSVAQSCLTLQPHGLQQIPGVHSNSCPLSGWCHPIISSSVVPFSSHLQSLPASGSLQMSQFFASGGQSIEVSASASILPMNIQDWCPLGWTGCISLQSKGLSRVFSHTTVQSINSSVLSLLHSPTLTSIHDSWKNHSFD